MQAIKFTAKKKDGTQVNRYKFTMSEETYRAHSEDSGGMCVMCGDTECFGVEPDARAYECEACEGKGVYGIEELMLMGYIDLSAASEENF